MTSHITALLKLANYSGLLAKKIPRGVYIDTHNLKAMELEDFKIAIQEAAGEKACTIEIMLMEHTYILRMFTFRI